MALILVADSSEVRRQTVRSLVEAQDHVVVEADSAVYCLEIAEYHHPQCIFVNPDLADADEVKLLPMLKTLDILTFAIVPSAASESSISVEIFQASQDNTELRQKMLAIFRPDLTLSPPLSEPDDPAAVPQKAAVPDHAPSGLVSFDHLQTLTTLGIDQASETLNSLTDCPIDFQVATVETMTARSLSLLLKGRFGDATICAAQLPFHGGLSGTAQLFFPTVSGDLLTTALTGEEADSDDFTELKEEALTEVGNIVLNSVMGTMSNGLSKHLDFAVPEYAEDTIEQLTRSLADIPTSSILLAQTQFHIPDLNIQGDILLFFKMSLFFDITH